MELFTRMIVTIMTWLLNLIFEAAMFAIWLLLYAVAVIGKLTELAISGGKADVRISGWNHAKAARSLLAEDEPAEYCGYGGWHHHYYRNGQGSQVVYIYLTPRRILLVSKNHGSYEFRYGEVGLNIDQPTGHIGFNTAAQEVSLGFVSDDAINKITSSVNTSLAA